MSHKIGHNIGVEQKSYCHMSTGSAGESWIGENSSSSVRKGCKNREQWFCWDRLTSAMPSMRDRPTAFWVVAARSAVLSVITGGGKWVEINTYADPLYQREVLRAARALLRWEQRDLAKASSVSLPTIKRLESMPGAMAAHMSTIAALKNALESAGIEFIDENGGGPGVRLQKRPPEKS
jgi:hypothetical protein